MIKSFISVSHLVKKYDKVGTIIFDNVSFSIDQFQSVAIVGASGVGKSTMMKLLSGLISFDSGNIVIDNMELNTLEPEEMAQYRRNNIGFVFQDFRLIPNLSVLDNVKLSFYIREIEVDEKLCIDLLSAMKLKNQLDVPVHFLSGGEQQRVALARALSVQPKILFADEPTGNLDHKTSNEIVHLLFTMKERYQFTLLLVTHDLKLAQQCDRIIEINESKNIHIIK